MIPTLLRTEAWPSWSQTFFYRRTIKFWENFPWEVNGFSSSCHSWEVSYASACWKTCSEQSPWFSLWDERTSVCVTRTHRYNWCFALKTYKWKSEQQTYCLCIDATASSHDGASSVMAKSNPGLCSCSVEGNCRSLSTIAKYSKVLIWPPNKSQENFSEAKT